MPEPSTIVGAVFAGLAAILKFAQQSAHFVEVTSEVRQLQVNVRLADDSINTARRLIRLRGHYLSNDLLNDIERSINHTEIILQSLRDSVEGCRKDIETKGTVGVKNRTIWVIFKSQEFLSKLATLTNAMNALNRDINRVEIAKVPEMTALPPIYTELVDDDGNRERTSIRSFPRSPTIRRKLEKEKSQRCLCTVPSDGRDNLGVQQDDLQGLRHFSSTVSFASSVTAVERHFEQPQSNDSLTHVMSAPTTPFELPGSMSLGYGSDANLLDKPRNDYVVEDWEREEADKMHSGPMMPLPVPPKPKAPRRRSNFI